jgi:Co/Zn/Cd efflux system component
VTTPGGEAPDAQGPVGQGPYGQGPVGREPVGQRPHGQGSNEQGPVGQGANGQGWGAPGPVGQGPDGEAPDGDGPDPEGPDDAVAEGRPAPAALAADPALRRTVATVAALNLGYFGVEAGVALAIGSVALLADSVDFLEDASVNLLILLALSWSAPARARLGFVMAGLLLVPGLATLWQAWGKLADPAPPAPLPLAAAALGALAVNGYCAWRLARFRRAGGSLALAAFYSARNDAAANLAIVAAGLVTAFLWRSPWPDLAVGLAIAALNAGAAWEVLEAARAERRAHRA